MPSEAQSQEPRDRGPPPPVTRAGRSAQLAKAAATSPAPERRPRGRPRKDGSSGRSAPPTPPPPTPPPPPPPPPAPKSRKKGRSRGRAQVEDEESMDATEKKKTPPKTEVKETSGRRRSTSRRKSNANPEPSPDRLSPDPDPDPPTAPESRPEPAPSAEEDRTSPAAAAPLPDCSPGPASGSGEPPPSPSPSPDRSPVHSPAPSPRPAPHPAEEDRPSPSHCPAPMEVDCSPSTVPMETEGGGASPAAPSPALSPCSSPPASPCPRLEDEDSLSPLFQRSLSEDSGASPTPSLGHTEKRLKQCAFCYRGDEPPLGQGRLVVFGPTPGYIPLHILNRRTSSDRDSDCHDHCYRGNQALPTCSSPEQCEEESSSEFVEQLGAIGLPHDINVQSLFDPTGQCCAHLQCAAWSEGVCRGEGQSLLYVDKAIDSGSTQVCAFCHRLGATLRCRETGCGRSYHFPCAAAAGAHQDWNQRHTLCTRHAQTVSSQCVSCSGGGDVSGLLLCCCCGSCYHGSCLDPPLAPSPLCRAGWQCPQCRVCQSCRLRGDDGVLLVCERCDKAYHTHCLTPPLEHTPGTSWSCKNCRVCRRCGVRSSGQWANHPFLCESCDPALPCPLCGHAPNLYSPQDYLTCICCYRCVHTECIVQTGEGRAGSEGYVCSTCRTQEEELIPHSPTPALPHSPTHPHSISQPPVPNHTEVPPISPTAHSPGQLICSEPAQSPTKTICTSLRHSPPPSHPDPTELKQSPTTSHLDPTELKQSPTTSHQDPTELQQCLASSDPDPTELKQIPLPSHTDPTEHQQSPAPSQTDLTEHQQSSAPSHADSTELQQSPTPPNTDPTEHQQSPAPSHADPTELQLSLAPSEPDATELQQSPLLSHADSTELQQSPLPSHADPTELQQSPLPSQADPTELQQSPLPSHADPTELQQSPLPSHADPTELQQSPVLSHTDPTELPQSPAPSHTEPTEVPQSPAPSHTEPTEVPQSPAPSHTEPTELPQSPAPNHSDPTEHQQSPAPSHTDPTELKQIPPPSQTDPTELQQSPASSHADPTELQQIPPPSHADPTELQQSPAPSHPDPTELQQIPPPSHTEPTELQHSPVPPDPDLTELQQSPVPSHPDPTERQEIPPPSQTDPPELQESLTPCNSYPTEHQESHAPSHLGPTELHQSPLPSPTGPAELQQSPTHVTSKQAQYSPSQVSYCPSSPTQNSTEDQLMATESQPSPMQSSPMSCSHAHSPHSPPPHSQTQVGYSPTRLQPGPAELNQSSTPHSPAQDNITQSQLDRPCSLTNIVTQPQHSPPQIGDSPTPGSPAQVCTSSPQSPIQHAEPTLDQESPGSSSPAQLPCGAAQNISTLDQDLSQVNFSSTRTARNQASLRPLSAPCSPSPSPLRPTQCSLSQPASPGQGHSTKPVSLFPFQLATQASVTKSPNLDGHTLENSPTSLSHTLDLSTTPPASHCVDDQPLNQLGPVQSSTLSPPHVPAVHTPESLVHISTSVEHSSLTSSPYADETEEIPPTASHIHQNDSPSRCTEAIADNASPIHIQNRSASASPTHASEMPTSPVSSLLACASPMPMVTIPAHVSPVPAETIPITQPASPVKLTESCSAQPISPLAPPVRSSTQPAIPSAADSPVHPILSQDDEMAVAVDHPSNFIHSETSPSLAISTPDSPLHASPSHASTAHTDTNSGCSLIGSMHVQERTSSSVCTEVTQTNTSPTHHGQSSPSHVLTVCSPSETTAVHMSYLPTQTSSSPSHCRPTDASPASSSVSHSLSNLTSDCSGHTSTPSARVTDVSVIHSPPRSSPAGHASPLHIQNTSSSAHSGPVQRQTPSLASTTHSSPAHATVACVSPPYSPAQASETNCSPTGSSHYNPAPDTEVSSGITVAQLRSTSATSSLDVDTAASPIIQSSVLTDGFRQAGPTPANSLPDSTFVVSQASVSQVDQPPASPVSTPDRSAVESQQSTALVSPLHQGPATPVDATSTQASPGHASPVHSGPTQDNTAMPSSPCSVPTQVSPPQTLSFHASQASSVHNSPVSSPVCGPLQSGDTQTTPSPDPTSPVQPEDSSSPGPTSPVQPEDSPSPCPTSTVQPEESPSPGPVGPMNCEASPGPGHVSPVLATPVESETSPGPGPTSPVQPDPDPHPAPASLSGPSPQQHTQTERESAATDDVPMAEEQEALAEQRKTEEEEEMKREAPQQEEEEEEEGQEPPQESPEEEDLKMLNMKQGVHSVLLGSVLTEDHQSPPHNAAASPIPPQPALPSPRPTTPHSALLPQQPSPSTSPPASTLPSSQSPPRAGSLEASPPHRTALPPSCSPHTPLPPSPLLEDRLQEEEPTNQGEAKTVIENITLSSHRPSADDDSQSQSLFEPVAVATEPTKDKHQSHAEPSEREGEEPPEAPEPAASDVAAAHEVVAGKQPVKEKQDADEEREEGGVSDGVDEEEVEEATRQDAEQVDQSDVEEEEPMSPVLDLDPSLDMEVMELMTSSSPPPSLLHLSTPSPPPRRGKGRSLRPPPCSSRPSDDLSIRLRQSPFSTEASPETSPTRLPVTPPPLYPPSPPLRSSPPPRESPPLSKPQVPPTTVLPLTPKIGMGKPAISKRKFSPGRARVKQGSWWSNCRAVSPPSSSQDSTGEGGWDSPKPRPPDSPLWSMRVGRGSGFPGRRRSRGGGIGGGRGGRGRSRLKTQDSVTVSPGCGFGESVPVKEEEENSMHNTVVMFSTSDHFTLRQDMCVVCGSFGQGAEGRLLACSQCGQCYHPYCVNVKITRVILTKGWRCLECTVCEACGEASDPGRLLLCDDCDISYHTYCLDPPLHTVPKGSWKCKWCVWCVQCGSTSPGQHCEWQSNYSRCGPCGSLSRCPLCQRQYTQDDLILQCQQCDRWVHAVCQGLTTEDEVEVAADEGFNCSLCRTHGRSSYGRSDSFDSPYMAQIISRIREPDTKTYTQDGVCLTESGLSQLQSLVEPLTSPRRYRRCKPKLKLRIINQNSVSVLQTPPDPNPPTEQDHSRGELECEMKSDSSPEREHAHDDDVTKEPEVTDGNKKRKRKPYRPGIGGFMVRQRGGKAGPSRIKLCRKDSSETLAGRDEGLLDADVTMETAPPADQTMEKVKKRYRKKKTKLEEAFPSYLQEAFFGRDLLDRSRQAEKRPGADTSSASQSGAAATGGMKGPAPGAHGPSPSGLPVGAMATNRKQGTLHMSEEALMDLSDVLNTDPHILATGHTGQFQVERSPSPFAGLDIGSMADDPSLTSEPTGSGGRGQRAVQQEEPLDAILSPELDKMVTDGAILSKLYKIPELEGKDVEEVFTAVLSPNSSSNQPEQSQHTHTAGSKTHTQHAAAAGVFPRLPVMNGLMGAAPHFPNAPMMPSGAPGPAGSFRMPAPEGPAATAAPGLASANQVSGEGEQDVLSTAQRSMLKWEKEETLGEMATVAPVLYCNTNFPQLREQYPDWSTRVKQIAKLWRKASSQDRAPYVQKARDNRAAQRINKVQLSNEPLKRHPPPSQQPPPPPPLPGPYDPVSMETELAFKDPLRPKESEQEQEWKFRQQMRQKSKQLAKIEATQKLEQVKNEQLLQQRQQQQLLANQSPMMAAQQPVAGGNASPLQPAASREVQARQHLLQSSGLADDVFLRPQAPPPSGFSSLPHSPHPSSPLHQPPSSPQMFSPPSSRPSSPWDPYSKVVGTPRPTSSQGGGLPAPQQQRCNSLSASPAHDAFGSPAPSPDSKTSDVSRALGPQPGLQQSRGGVMSPPSGSAPDHQARLAAVHQRTPHNSSNIRVADSYGRAGELVQGGVFKAPMPPQHQPQQEVFGSSGGGVRRDPSRPTDLGFALPQSQDPSFPSSPLSGLSSPHRSPYAQTPGTPRPDYSQQISDPFAQQSPLTSRPSPDPYTNPQTPGTPRPHSDPTYLTTPPALRLDQYNQQSANCRPSPSHPTLDPYASNPGTPRPSVGERFPRSPGSQRSTEHYAQPAGTPRPSPDPYAQQPSTPRPQKAPEAFNQAPAESFPPQPARSDSSPLAPGLSGETVPFTQTHHQLQQSPGRPPSSQTPKHPGMSEEIGFAGLASQTPGHDPFEQGHMTPGPSQTDKTVANEMAALSAASLDGPMSMLPQLGDSEEKLRQRQRLRQLILRQQQQKSALRQEKGLQEPPVAPPAAPPGPTTPRAWSQDSSSISNPPPADLFGRPPPPYPGTVRPAGAAGAPAGAPRFPGGFPGEQQRGFLPSEAPFPRQTLSRELGVRGPALRFGVPPGAPAGLQETFLRPPQGSVPGAGLGAAEGVPVQMRRPMPGDFTGIRLLTAPNAHQHVMPAVPQPFLSRSLPIQQHSIMGQPYIELRHRVPENRLRLPFSLSATQDPEASLVHPRDPQLSPARPGPGARMGEGPLGQQMLLAGGVEQLNQQDQRHLGHVAESALPGADGIEEHLEGEDSAVKDLEDVEVKDLVDLNLNLDPEDGKEDLDLGPNDLHLDDFLLSGKFDLIAYADPELNLEDKKDMFNEELDLGEPMEEKEGGERRDRAGAPARKMDNHTHLIGQVKQEVEDGVKTEAQHSSPQPGLVSTRRLPGAPGATAAGSSLPGSKEKLEDSGSASGVLSALQAQEQALSMGTAPGVHPPMAGGQPAVFQQQQQQQQRPSGPPSAVLTPQGAPATPHPLSLLLSSQTQTKPLLLEEQPLLLQDLLDQERQEQQQQKQMQAMIRQKSSPDPVFPNMADFDSISDPIMKAKMVALKGINKVMTQQGNLGLNPIVINRFQQAPGAPAPAPEGTPQPPHLLGQVQLQDGKLNPQLVRPNPPSFGPGFVNESQRRQYEEWLGETQQLLQMQQRLLEDQIAAHRKTKKALSAKQRTAKKAGRVLGEDDAAQLRYITEQQGTVQKQLEQIRKQQKDHSELIEDYRTKQQQRVLQQQPAAPPMMPAGAAPPMPQTLLSQPPVPMQPHPGGPAPTRLPNVPPGWTPGGGAPGVMGQRMVQPLLPPQMPPALPNAPQAPLHTQTPPAMVPGLSAPPAGFTAGPRGPTGGSNGAAGDAAATAPQVKFDDNNPFSEGFQERERRERLREQQERQRVQLMQEVERHRVLQQRLELEQQGLLGAPPGPGARVGPPPGPAAAPPGDTLSQMPFFSSELPQDFLQSPPASRPLPPLQGQAGAPFLQQGFTGGPLHPGAHPAPGVMPGAAERGRAPPEHGPPMDIAPSRPRLPGPAGPSAQGQVHPAGIGGAGITPSHPGGQGHRFDHDSSSSSPSTPLPPSFPCSSSGGPASLLQLYSDIIPEDKPKKKRSRKRDGDDTTGGARTPLSSHSDDITAPPTPAVSDTSCSTPTRGSVDLSDLSFPQGSSLSGLPPSSELERQLSVSSAQERGSLLGMEAQRGPLSGLSLEVKEEREERGACGGGMVKMEEGDGFCSSPLQGGGKEGDGGKELLRHLLKDKASPATTPSPTGQAPPAARRQLSNESVRSEEEDRPGSHGNMMTLDSPGRDLDSAGKKKPQRCKRVARPEKDKAPPKNKRRKREEEEKTLHAASSDPLMTHLRQLSVLPLMEPVLGVDLSLFPPYGSSSLGRDSRLSGSFGNACLDGVTDYYSQLIYKQNNLSNPPTPPASLPPTPPPVARQKLVNGFATTEELSRKELSEQDVKGVSGLKQKGEELLALNHSSKTVDVPASLPTPPHNNQEELRVQDSSGRSSPDGFVPSSSPESVADMEVSRYPDLSFIKLEPPSPCPSPPIPIMPCAWGKGSAVKQEVKAEPNHQGPPSCSSTDLVTIAITLNPVAAQNVTGVMAAVAELLRVPVPNDYQLSRAGGLERSALSLLAGVRVPLPQGAAGSRQQRPVPPAAGVTGVRMDYNQHGGSAAGATRPQCCSYCKVLLGNGVRIIKELKQEGQSRPGSSLVFCSPDCSALYTSGLQSRTAGNKCASRVQHQYANNMSSIAVHSLPTSPPSPASPAVTTETRPRMDSLKVKVKLKPRPRAVPGGDDSPSSRHGKKVKSSRWRRWSVNITLTRGPGMSSEVVAMPTEAEVDMLLEKLGACLRPDPLPRDQRRCCFCHQLGDGPTDGPARLLNLDLDLWVHLNCALWSSEVYETQAGALINVELALRRGLTLRCAHCQQTGATSGCNRLRCTNTYHFTCALQARCTFFKDKTMLCHLHKPRMVPLSGDRSSSGSPSSTPGPTPDPAVVMASDPYDSELRCFAVFRRVFVQRDEARQIAAVVQRGERQHTFRVGSLLFRAIGRLLPQQMNAFHNKTAIFPIGYHANRIYWSMRHSSRRCKYMCYIEEEEGRPLFKVKVVEKGHDDLILTGSTPKAVWDQILEPVSQMRSTSGTLKLFPVYLKGEDLFGLTTSAVSRIIESLPGVEACERYTFRYGRNPLMEWPLAFNPSGSARSEPKAYQAKRPYLLTSIAPRCQGSVGSIVGLVPGVISLSPGESVAGAHQGRHSKSSQYRRMKAEWKSNVYLARSRIQGLGLYAARDIEKCTMVIEYIGTIIRSEVANRKERLYESQNRGVYMFRIDNDFVIDATITGGPARYINHSCAPNCITEVVTVEKENKIIISSCRRIQRGEELSYDYKFDLEDDQHKIPCHCGAVNCRKWMN